MLASRDQENLVHGHQQAAASKPLNQGTRQLAPKTPGNKALKSPFKLPLNDENGHGLFGAGKSVLKTNGKANENLATGPKKAGLGDKDAFKTPMGPRNRAPLGLKTTNAKTKAFHIPPPPEDVPDKSQQKSASASARKGRPRVSHAEMTKLDIHHDLDQLKEMEPEYMPPPAKNLPDYPDDIHEMDFKPFPDDKSFMEVWMREHLHEPDAEGLSYVQRQELAHQKELELSEKESHAQAIFDLESLGVPCTCEPDCPEDNCKLNIPRKKAAQQKYDKTMAELHPERKSAAPKPTLSKSIAAKPPHKKPLQTKGPSTLTSKSAASLLSQPKPSTTVSKPRPQSTTTAKARLPFSNISSRKQTPPPTNPSPMRHTAATLASKTTIGRSAGRATSANYRKTAAPNASTKPPITALPPSFERDYEDDLGFEARPLEELLREGAEEDFVLEL